MVEPYTLITSGQFLNAILSVYTNVMGSWVYALVLFFGFTLIYLKTQNIGTVAVVAMLIGGTILTTMPPEVHNLAYFLLVLGLAAIMYKAFKG